MLRRSPIDAAAAAGLQSLTMEPPTYSETATSRTTSASAGWVRSYIAVTAIAMCVVGFALATRTILAADGGRWTGDSGGHPHSATPTNGVQEAHTWFGVLSVEPPQLVHGVTAKALAGNAHGIAGYVAPDRQLVQVPVTLYNDLERPVRYDPRWFRVVSTNRRSTPRRPPSRGRNVRASRSAPASASFNAGVLQPRTAISGQVSFVAPRNGGWLRLELREPGRRTLAMALGRGGEVYQARPGDFANHARRTHRHRSRGWRR